RGMLPSATPRTISLHTYRTRLRVLCVGRGAFPCLTTRRRDQPVTVTLEGTDRGSLRAVPSTGGHAGAETGGTQAPTAKGRGEFAVATGTVKWFSSEKGFGFI